MNLSEFIDTYREAITRQVIDTYPPLYRPSPDEESLPKLVRPPLPGQENAIRSTALSLKSQKGSVIVGEMGCGKTYIGITAASLAGFQRVLVLAPPHLTRKWQREVRQTIPGAQAAIINSITDLERLRTQPNEGILFGIMSRERAKLSFHWKPAAVWRWARNSKGLIYEPTTLGKFLSPACPSCYAWLQDSEGIPLTQHDLSRKRLKCERCGESLWTADRTGPKRYALAEYIKNHMRNFWQLLIADEVHEYKARGSAQGIAAGTLAEVCDKSLTLTGTLMGGYASTLFHLLYRFSPEIRNEFEQDDEGRWIKRYGFEEIRIKKDQDEWDEEGRYSRRRHYRKQVKEKPGLAPAALFHLIGNSVFLRLSDIASELPPYEEEVILTGLDTRPTGTMHGKEDLSQARAYNLILNKLKEKIAQSVRTGSKRLLGTYLQTLLAYPDGCTRGETVVDPDTKEVIVAVPPLPEDRTYPKEQALIDLVAAERMKGRRVLVYVTHTGTRDITGRWSQLLTKQGFRVAVLKADTVSPEKREAWVDERVKEGIDVLMCHPRLVQTGLDLIDFPTICWAETDYSVYTMRQASRRSWRIGQDRPVKVSFLAYRDTMQTRALQLVAKKLTSSLAVEGELTEDGLAAYGDDGQDFILTLAHQIVEGLESEDNDPVEEAFRTYRRVQDEGEHLLVDDSWLLDRTAPQAPTNGHHADEPEPGVPDPEEDRKTTQISLADFLSQETAPPKRRRKPKPSPAYQSLFEWALELEQAETQQKGKEA